MGREWSAWKAGDLRRDRHGMPAHSTLGQGAQGSYAGPCAALQGSGSSCSSEPDAAWRASAAAAAQLSLAPASTLAVRSQLGRVTLDSGAKEVRVQPLQVVDAAGGVHALLPGVQLQLPLQSLRIMAVPA